MWVDRHICRNNCKTTVGVWAENWTTLRSDPDASQVHALGKTCIVTLKDLEYASRNHTRRQHTLSAQGSSGRRNWHARSAVCRRRMCSPHLAGRADVAASGGLRGKKKKPKNVRQKHCYSTGRMKRKVCLSVSCNSSKGETFKMSYVYMKSFFFFHKRERDFLPTSGSWTPGCKSWRWKDRDRNIFWGWK